MKTRQLTTKFKYSQRKKALIELRCPKCGYKPLRTEKEKKKKTTVFTFHCFRCHLIDKVEVSGNCRGLIDAYCLMVDRLNLALKQLKPQVVQIPQEEQEETIIT
jgi:transcription elongation factor Elf1